MNFRNNQEMWELKSLSRRAKKSSQAFRAFDEGKDELKTEYQKDIERIIGSEAFHNLRHKSQICLAQSDEMTRRNRLSHTLEVSQLAKAIGQSLQLNCELIEAIALAHDLGQTPFGHAGEKALSLLVADRNLTFNHNVQSVWVADQYTSSKYSSFSEGLNLTYDTLEGIWKHRSYVGQVSEYEARLQHLNPYSSGSLESQVVMHADVITRCVHDLFDANQSKILTYDRFKSEFWDGLMNPPFCENTWQQTFVRDLIQNSYNKDEVAFSIPMGRLMDKLKVYLDTVVFKSRRVLEYDAQCFDVIQALFTYYESNIEKLLRHKPRYETILRMYGKERLIIDHLQSLSDRQATYAYEMMAGIRLGGRVVEAEVLEQF